MLLYLKYSEVTRPSLVATQLVRTRVAFSMIASVPGPLTTQYILVVNGRGVLLSVGIMCMLIICDIKFGDNSLMIKIS